MIHVETFPVPPLGCNCSVLRDDETREAIVIDPGGDAPGILKRLHAHGLTVKAIVHTHTHIDHVGATAAVQRDTGAPARIHEGDLFLYDMLPVQAQLVGVHTPPTAELDAFLRDGEVLRAGAISLEVIHTPGHTPGSVCFRCKVDDKDVLFSGRHALRGEHRAHRPLGRRPRPHPEVHPRAPPHAPRGDAGGHRARPPDDHRARAAFEPLRARLRARPVRE